MNFNRLQALIDRIPALGVPGCDIMVCREGEMVFRRFAGMRDREAGIPINGEETYWFYSPSKIVTVVAALTLYERGEFLMTDPLSEFIPAFCNMTVRETLPNGEVKLRPARGEITMRNLFTMTSGIDYDLSNPCIARAVEETCGRAPTVKMAEAMAEKPLLFDPGEHFLYGLSHDVLAAVVEIVSGTRFSDYVQKTIFDPCGMTRSAWHLTEDLKATMATRYVFNDETMQAERDPEPHHLMLGTEYESGGAGLITTVEDYMRFAEMLRKGGQTSTGERVLSPRTVNLMRTNHLNPQQLKDLSWPWLAGYGYGLGVRTMMDPAANGALSPVGEFGWSGAAGVHVVIDPENALTMVYAQHMLNNLEGIIHPRLRNVLYACL